MKRIRTWPFAVGVLLLMASCTPTLEEETLQSEEYRVLDALIRHDFGGSQGMVVLEDQTETQWTGASVDYFQGIFPEMEQSVAFDFIKKNETSYLLENLFQERVCLIGKKLRDFIFSHGGWEEFYHRYPNSGGIMDVSRVGLNSRLDQAVVYAGCMYYYLAGAGYYFFLQKNDGGWTVIRKKLVWIS